VLRRDISTNKRSSSIAIDILPAFKITNRFLNIFFIPLSVIMMFNLNLLFFYNPGGLHYI